PRLAEGAGRSDATGTRSVWGEATHLDRTSAGAASNRADRRRRRRSHRPPRAKEPRLCLPPSHLDTAPEGGGGARLPPKTEGVEAIMSAAAEIPPHFPSSLPPPALPPVRHEVVDPANKEAVAWLCELLRAGQADLYGQDEADLALLPTLARTWMPRGEQLKVAAPGNNEKCSVSAAVDLAEGWLGWFTHEKRCAEQFGDTLCACAARSEKRGRLAVLLVDNAQSHQVGKTGIVRGWLDRLEGRVVLVFQPK